MRKKAMLYTILCISSLFIGIGLIVILFYCTNLLPALCGFIGFLLMLSIMLPCMFTYRCPYCHKTLFSNGFPVPDFCPFCGKSLANKK